MAERQGFMIWHEDGNMLTEANDQTLAAIVRSLIAFSTTGERQELSELTGMEKALYNSMISKIIRDDERYYESVKANTIKGLMSGIISKAKAEGKRISNSVAKAQAEQMYNERYNSGQPLSTVVDHSQLTKRSVAELNVSPSLSITSSRAVAGAEATASAEALKSENDKWAHVLGIAKSKRSFDPYDHKKLSEYFHNNGYDDTLDLVEDDEALTRYLNG